MPDTTPPRTSRREANRAATHRAIVQAVYGIAVSHGPDALTVDAVAERAQISRRTFFNYFSSLEDALTDPLEELLKDAFAEFDRRPADEPLLVSVGEAFGVALTADKLPRLVQQIRLCRDNRVALRHLLERWHGVEDQVHAALVARLPDAEPLLTSTVAAALINTIRAAFDGWLARHADTAPAADGPPPPHLDARLPELQADVARALGYLGDGFRAHLPQTP